MMYNENLLTHRGENAIRFWKSGEFPMPDWVPSHMAGGIEANGTFAIETELGRARVHPGNVLIEHGGNVWVRQTEEVADFVKGLERIAETPAVNVGPGKVR